MHDDSVLVAIDAALRSPAFCACGKNLTVAIHDEAAWLQCATLAGPSRLPAFIREALHDHRWLVEWPGSGGAPGRSSSAPHGMSSRVLRPRPA